MNFKKPRDPNTDPGLLKIRDVSPVESIRCQVGNGECQELAIEAQDNGYGEPFYLCPAHALEFRQFATLVAEMTPNQISNLEQAISVAMRQ